MGNSLGHPFINSYNYDIVVINVDQYTSGSNGMLYIKFISLPALGYCV